MTVSQKDIARLLGVNQTTVSRALRGNSRISDEMRTKVANLCEQLGYEPDYLASSLSAGETRVISALKLSRRLNDLHSRWIDCLEEAAHDRGYRFRLDRMDDIKRIAGERSSDGFIVFGRWDRQDPKTMSYVYRTNRPVVYTDCDSLDLPSEAVAIDNRGGAAQAVSHLLELGHQKIVFFGLIENHAVCRERHNGYVTQLNNSGMPATAALCIEHHDWPVEPEDVFPYETKLLEAIDQGATAILATSDIGAVGAYKLLRRHGLEIPGDVSLIGFDDTLLARAFEPPLTTVRQDVQAASVAAVDKLISLISGTETPGTIIPATLVVRGTSAPPTSRAGGVK